MTLNEMALYEPIFVLLHLNFILVIRVTVTEQ